MLSAHLSAQELTAVDDEALVFPAPGGGLWAYGNFRRRIWIPAMRSAGLDGVGFHDLRRTAATSLVLAGVDLKTAGTRLGHSDPRLTLQVYAQATTGADQAAAEAVAEHFALATAAG
jgi:integrase